MPVTRGTSEYSSVGVAKPEQANGTGTKSTIRILVVRYVFDFVSDSRGPRTRSPTTRSNVFYKWYCYSLLSTGRVLFTG